MDGIFVPMLTQVMEISNGKERIFSSISKFYSNRPINQIFQIMKIMKFICLLTIIVSLSSCPKSHNDSPYSYYLRLSFQDPSGNDLVRGIEYIPEQLAVKQGLYQLDVWFPENEYVDGEFNELGFREGAYDRVTFHVAYISNNFIT